MPCEKEYDQLFMMLWCQQSSPVQDVFYCINITLHSFILLDIMIELLSLNMNVQKVAH